MIELNKIEDMVAGWVKPIPHLPINGKKWLAENVWWITLVGVILTGLGAVALISAMYAANNMMNYFDYYVAQSYTGWQMFVVLVSLLFAIASMILMGMAIKPLKMFKRKGWDLMFMALLLNVLMAVVNIFINYSSNPIGSILSAAIGFIIGAYFLFEIRSYFVKAK